MKPNIGMTDKNREGVVKVLTARSRMSMCFTRNAELSLERGGATFQRSPQVL